jgi:hypothetical protein
LGEGLAKVRVAVDTMGSGFGSARRSGVDRFHVPAWIVLGLLVIESLIGTRRRLREVTT